VNGNSFDFLRDVASFADNTNSVPKNKLARIDPDYDPAGFPTTLPRVIFDGERLLTRKRYHALSPYIPEPGDRVLMIPVSTSYLIAGSVDQRESLISRRAVQDRVDTNQSTTSQSFTNLSTFGPSVTVTTGSVALVTASALIGLAEAGTGAAIAAIEVSGATSIPPNGDLDALGVDSFGTGSVNRALNISYTQLFTELKPGQNTFTLKYRAHNGISSRFARRKITVVPL
jgi:hypothetical protein